MKTDEIKKMVREQMPGWELVVKEGKPVSEKAFRIRLTDGSGPVRIAEIKNGKVRVVSG